MALAEHRFRPAHVLRITHVSGGEMEGGPSEKQPNLQSYSQANLVLMHTRKE